MNYVLTYEGKLPPHFEHCVRQIKHVDKEARVILVHDGDGSKETENIKLSSLSLPDFGTYFSRSSDPLWITSLRRVFILNEIKGPLVHFDTDVLIYEPFSSVNLPDGVFLTPHKEGEFTFGYSYISDKTKYKNLCSSIYSLLKRGETFTRKHTGDQIHEMRLLGYCGKGVITPLPVHPRMGEGLMFDPSSYGQFLGGTPNGHAPGFIDKEQLVGSILSEGSTTVNFSGKPTISYWGKTYPLSNLHIHSKELWKFSTF